MSKRTTQNSVRQLNRKAGSHEAGHVRTPAPIMALAGLPATPQRPKLPEKRAGSPKAAMPKAPQRVEVTFVLPESAGSSVAVCGDFNDWSPGAAPLERHEDGRWETTLSLKPGRYEYKFVVDGHWIADPQAREHVLNPHGTLNSVVEVPA